MDILRISWKGVGEYSGRLARKMKGFRPDVIVAIARGGLVPARLLADELDVRTITVLGVSFQKNIRRTAGFPSISQESALELRGKKVLVVDDVADIGRSLLVAKDYALRRGASEAKTAALHYKPNPMFKPDYYAELAEGWIIYPWEEKEMKKELKKSS